MKFGSNFIIIGKILAAFGIKGHLKLFISDDFREYISENLKKIEFSTIDGKKFNFRLLFEKNGILFVEEKNIKDRNQAEMLSGTELRVEKLYLPEFAEDEYLYSDLIGLQVLDESGISIGKISAVNNFGAGDIVEISFNSGETELIPFKAEYFLEISTSFVRIKPPKYL